MFNITLGLAEREARDQALGRYMDAFARMERMLQVAIQALLNLDEEAARPIFATLMTKQSIDLLEASAKIKLNAKDADRVKTLCEKLARRNTKRNRIIHGYWSIFVKMPQETQEWIRMYDHVDPAFAVDPDNPKVLGTYTFTVPELDNVTGHVEETVQALSVLTMDIPAQLARRLTPEEMFRQWVSARLAATGAKAPHLPQG